MSRVFGGPPWAVDLWLEPAANNSCKFIDCPRRVRVEAAT